MAGRNFESWRVYKSTPKPRNSPWGAIQSAKQLAPGIWHVTTASHGGIGLSSERYAAMPENMKATTYSSGGWYEEDCDWALVAMVFPEAFDAKAIAAAKQTVKNFYVPEIADQYRM